MTKEKAKDQSEAEAGKKKKKEEEREREKKREKVRQELLKGVPTQEKEDEKKAEAKKEEVISEVAGDAQGIQRLAGGDPGAHRHTNQTRTPSSTGSTTWSVPTSIVRSKSCESRRPRASGPRSSRSPDSWGR